MRGVRVESDQEGEGGGGVRIRSRWRKCQALKIIRVGLILGKTCGWGPIKLSAIRRWPH